MIPTSLTAIRLTMADILARYSITLLRVSLGLVFLGFGVLKFFDRSPAQTLAERTTEALTFGLIHGTAAGIMVAALECSIGICLITGRQVRLGLALLAVTTVGILSPLVLFPDDLFAGKDHAPTLEGQYVLKDVVLAASGLVIAARELGGRPLAPAPERSALPINAQRPVRAERTWTEDRRS
jgi:putative oxidoreductase